MADIDLTRTHTLGLQGARQLAADVADRLSREFGVRTRWVDDSVHIEGRGVRGRLDAGPDAVRVTASVGLAARPFRRLLQREIERELDHLAPAPYPPPP